MDGKKVLNKNTVLFFIVTACVGFGFMYKVSKNNYEQKQLEEEKELLNLSERRRKENKVFLQTAIAELKRKRDEEATRIAAENKLKKQQQAEAIKKSKQQESDFYKHQSEELRRKIQAETEKFIKEQEESSKIQLKWFLEHVFNHFDDDLDSEEKDEDLEELPEDRYISDKTDFTSYMQFKNLVESQENDKKKELVNFLIEDIEKRKKNNYHTYFPVHNLKLCKSLYYKASRIVHPDKIKRLYNTSDEDKAFIESNLEKPFQSLNDRYSDIGGVDLGGKKTLRKRSKRIFSSHHSRKNKRRQKHQRSAP